MPASPSANRRSARVTARRRSARAMNALAARGWRVVQGADLAAVFGPYPTREEAGRVAAELRAESPASAFNVEPAR